MIHEMKSVIREYKYGWDTLYLKCTNCWEWKTIDRFYKKSGRPFGVRTECKECEKKYVQKNKEKISNRYSNWRVKNKEKIREYKRKYAVINEKKIADHRKEYYNNNREQILQNSREYKEYRTNELWFSRTVFHEKARHYANKYKLKPKECPICWHCGKIELHHPSYETFDKWSEVVFCCKGCHKKIHSWEIECPNMINLLYLTI